MQDYERTELIITEFDKENIIVTSGFNPNPGPDFNFNRDEYETYWMG